MMTAPSRAFGSMPFDALTNFSELSLGGQLGRSGKTGLVHEIRSDDKSVFKQYQYAVSAVHRMRLEKLVDYLRRQPNSTAKEILARAAWPLSLVIDGGQVRGVILPRMRPEYYFEYADGSLGERTLGRAIQERSPQERKLEILNGPARFELAYHLCCTLQILEADNMTFVDISNKNVCWRTTPAPGSLLLDCDDIHLVPSPITAAHRSERWEDPWHEAAPTVEEMRGQFALLFSRLVFAKSYPQTKERIVLPDNPLSSVFQSLVDKGWSGQLTQRPTVSDWRGAMETALSTGIVDHAFDPVSATSGVASAQHRRSQGARPSPTGMKRLDKWCSRALDHLDAALRRVGPS